jgi:hypothetical protein
VPIIGLGFDCVKKRCGCCLTRRGRNWQNHVNCSSARTHTADQPQCLELLQLPINCASVHVENLRHLVGTDPGFPGLGVGAALENAIDGYATAPNLRRVAINESILRNKKVCPSPAPNCNRVSHLLSPYPPQIKSYYRLWFSLENTGTLKIFRHTACAHSRGAITARRLANIPVALKPMRQIGDSNTKLADSPSWPGIVRLPPNGERKKETTPRDDFVENSQIPRPCLRVRFEECPIGVDRATKKNFPSVHMLWRCGPRCGRRRKR